jgi:hypothetical protein
LLSLAAHNLVATVTLGPAARLVAVHHSYPTKTLDDGVRLAIGDLYAREPRSLLVEIVASVPSGDAAVEVATLAIEADVLAADGAVERRTVRLPVRIAASGSATVDPEIEREVLLQATAKAREEALDRRRQGDLHGAAESLRNAARRVRDAGIADEQLLTEAEDMELMSGRFDDAIVAESDAKYLAQSSHNTRRSRSRNTDTFRRKRPGPTQP